MNHNTRSILVTGMNGIVIDIECQLSNGLPSIVIVGLGNRAIDEAKERIRSAFASSNLALPRKRITINLAPADVRKESTSFDLAIAAAIITSQVPRPSDLSANIAIIGEVGLSGAVRPVRGIIGKLIAGKKLGIDRFIIPIGNLKQAQLVPDVTLYPVKNLEELHTHITLGTDITTTLPNNPPNPVHLSSSYSLSQIIGQDKAKRAIAIAAAGGHNILLSGPPGTGKSMLAKTLPDLLPGLSQQEMLEVTHINSLADNQFDKLVTSRPFRAPHHSSSSTAIVGGGSMARPGELSLSHCGVFFMDEMPEFNRSVLEALRQPLEDKKVTIARANQTVEYQADFILVATANPCPCGFYGSQRSCSCSLADVARYQKKLSGPILDRIDLFVTVGAADHVLLLNSPKNQNDEEIKKQIQSARLVQQARYGNNTLNTHLNNQQIRKHANPTKEAAQILNNAATKLGLSPRSYMRTIRVARTIADLENSQDILPGHITESLQYRQARLNRA